VRIFILSTPAGKARAGERDCGGGGRCGITKRRCEKKTGAAAHDARTSARCAIAWGQVVQDSRIDAGLTEQKISSPQLQR